MGDSNLEAASVKTDIVRYLFSVLDRPAYWLLGLVYQLFFNVASADLFNNGTIMAFYKRVQLIIGVFMMFQLALTILKGIMNPDSFTDAKNGVSSLVKRVSISLILLAAMVPISIPGARNEWERQLNNNGVLFGTLYSLQYRILNNNTLGRLILGTDDSAESFTSADNTSEDSSLARSARVFTSTILKGFYRINLLPEADRPRHEEGKDDAIYNENRVCQDIDDEILKAYTRIDADPGEVISMVNLTCVYDSSDLNLLQKAFATVAPKLSGKSKYVFAYMPFISAVVAFIFVFILLNFTVEIAVRSVKLAVLRLIAPIPIISYMDPKGSKDSSFNSWVKTLTSTYLDLFIRLATVFFVIFLIQDMITNGIYINRSSGVLGTLSFILILIGLFIFAKQAPKFIKQVLGIKDDGGKMFGALGNLAGALGVGAAAVGSIGSGLASARASKMADETRQALGEHVDPTAFHNRAKHLLAGITGGVAGGITGAKAAVTAKDHALKSSLEAMQKRNASVLAKGNDGSTMLGRLKSSLTQYATGDGAAARSSRDIANMESRQKALDAVKSRVSKEMVKHDWISGNLGLAEDNDHNAIDRVNYKSFMAEYAAAQSRGDGVVTFKDVAGNEHTINFADAERQKGCLLKNNEDDYIRQQVAGTAPTDKIDNELLSLIRDATAKGGAEEVRDKDGHVLYTQTRSNTISSRDDVTKASEALGQVIRDAKRANMVNQANDRYSGKK